MNLSNRLTIFRIILSIIIVIVLIFPFDAIGTPTIKLFINESLVVDIKYFIAGTLFLIASITDYLDGYLARKRNQVTRFGKLLDAVADKILVNSVLIILTGTGFVHAIIPVVIITRDSIVSAIKLLSVGRGFVPSAIKTGKIKTACLMIGITLTLFYNMPFEQWNLQVANFFLLIAAILSVISAVQYYTANKHIIFNEN